MRMIIMRVLIRLDTKNTETQFHSNDSNMKHGKVNSESRNKKQIGLDREERLKREK